MRLQGGQKHGEWRILALVKLFLCNKILGSQNHAEWRSLWRHCNAFRSIRLVFGVEMEVNGIIHMWSMKPRKCPLRCPRGDWFWQHIENTYSLCCTRHLGCGHRIWKTGSLVMFQQHPDIQRSMFWKHVEWYLRETSELVGNSPPFLLCIVKPNSCNESGKKRVFTTLTSPSSNRKYSRHICRLVLFLLRLWKASMIEDQ